MENTTVYDLADLIEERITKRGLEILNRFEDVEMRENLQIMSSVVVCEFGGIEWKVTQTQYSEELTKNGDLKSDEEKLDEWFVEFKQDTYFTSDACRQMTASYYIVYTEHSGYSCDRFKLNIITVERPIKKPDAKNI